MGLFYAFFHWYRQSELTADRAGLLASQDLDAVINTEMKLAGGSRKLFAQMDREAFLQQGRDYEEMGKDALTSSTRWANDARTRHTRSRRCGRWKSTPGPRARSMRAS